MSLSYFTSLSILQYLSYCCKFSSNILTISSKKCHKSLQFYWNELKLDLESIGSSPDLQRLCFSVSPCKSLALFFHGSRLGWKWCFVDTRTWTRAWQYLLLWNMHPIWKFTSLTLRGTWGLYWRHFPFPQPELRTNNTVQWPTIQYPIHSQYFWPWI